MPTLEWIGKRAVVGHHRVVPFHLLKCDGGLSVGDPGAGNLLVQGDNLLALKALLPYYKGKVKCIYIDPPYNTGEEKWVYNDAVNSHEMRAWLGKVVGKEAEDLSRHDKWLCMMYPRLALLRELLQNDGLIFVSIGEDEIGSLRFLMDEIFSATNRLGTLVWKRRSSSAMRGTPLSIDHEYILVYARNVSVAVMQGIAKGPEGYPHEDERGRYASTDLTVGMNREERPGQFYTITNPRTGKEYPPNPNRVWRFFPETMQRVIADGLVIWPDDYPDRKMERPRYKTYYNPESAKPKPVSSWIESSSTNAAALESESAEFDIEILTTGMTQEGGKLLTQMFGGRAFAYPKPLSLVRSIFRAAVGPGQVALDAFAGSGTSGHAVLDLNREDGHQRKFVLVEMDKDNCEQVTAVRLQRAVEGYERGAGNGDAIEGLGGGFRFCRIGSPLFAADGGFAKDVKFNDLAHHIWFCETGEPLPKGRNGRGSPLLGVHGGTAIYLLYNGVLGDKSPGGGNVLTNVVLAALPKHNGPRVVFGEGCRLGKERLKREGIVFKQIPYDVRGTDL